MMILLKSHDRLIAVNGISVTRHFRGNEQSCIYDVVLIIATQELPNCILKSFVSYEQACKYLKCITWKIAKCSGNYVFYVEDYPT